MSIRAHLVPVRTKAKLRATADEHLQFIATNRDRVRSHFQGPIVNAPLEDFIVPNQSVVLAGVAT